MEIVKQLTAEVIAIVSGAFIGALKLAIETKSNKRLSTVVINFLIGLFAGVILGFHFSGNTGVLLAGLIALISGAVGAIAIDSIIEMFPNLFKKIVNKYFSK